MSERTRRRVTGGLIVAGALALLLALPLAYLDRNVFEPGGFSANVARAVQDDAVRARIAEAVSDQLVAASPRAVALAPVIEQTTDEILASGAAAGIVRAAAAETHNALFSRDRGSIVVDLANLGVVVIGALTARDPSRAAELEELQQLILPIADRSVATGLVTTGERLRVLVIVLPLLALACFTLALWISPLRRGAALYAGLAILVVAAVAYAVSLFVRVSIVASFEGDEREVAAGIVGAFLDGFAWWCAALGLVGVIIAAAAASLIDELQPETLPQRAWQWITRRRVRRRSELAGALVLVVAGLAVIADPLGALRLAALVVGAYLLFAGVVALLRVIVGPEPTPEELPSLRALRRRLAPLLVGSLALVGIAIAGAVVVLEGRGEDSPAVADAPGCNGSEALCDRRFDEVALPTSHNAMSSAQDGFLNANHGITLTRQLDLGIRGLQIDAYEGQRNRNGTVRTDLAPKAVEQAEAKIGAEGLAAAQRLAGSVAFGPVEGEKQFYFCHVVCELGAIEGVPFLERIRDWLDRNPRQVLSIMVEDAAPKAVIKRAFEEAGLVEYASDFQPAPGRPFPTLREMIDTGRRLWVAAEEDGDPGGWYHEGYVVTQETPFSFTTTAQLQTDASCRRNRGPADAPLFLVNSWVETYPPNPENADVVNRRGFLLERARRCERLRDLTTNLLAVDFVERGDVVGAAAALNGVTDG